MQGLVNQWSQYIPASGSIAGRGSGPGTSGGYKGAAAYFGSFRRPNETGQYLWPVGSGWADKVAAQAPGQAAPKPGSHEYWDITRAKGPAPQTEVAKAEPQYRPRSEPRPPAQVADAGPKTGSQEYWRGPKHGDHGDQAQEAVRVAQGRRSRGHATGEGDAQSQLPYAGSTMPPSSDAPMSTSTASYEGGGSVPDKVVINITVQARA